MRSTFLALRLEVEALRQTLRAATLAGAALDPASNDPQAWPRDAPVSAVA